MKEKCDFYVGQNVWSIRCGWTKINSIDLVLKKVYDKEGNTYTLDGSWYATDKYPVLFDRDILNGTTPPNEFKHGDVVMVSDNFHKDCFMPAFFYRDDKFGYYCYAGPIFDKCYRLWKNCISIDEYKNLLTKKD